MEPTLSHQTATGEFQRPQVNGTRPEERALNGSLADTMEEDTHQNHELEHGDDRHTLTLEEIYHSGLQTPLLQHLVTRLKALDSLVFIDDTVKTVDIRNDYLDALRPSYRYSYANEQTGHRVMGRVASFGFARCGMSALLLQDIQATEPRNRTDMSYYTPVFMFASSPTYPGLCERILTPIGYQIKETAESAYSKTLLTAVSKVANNSIYSLDTLGFIGRTFLPYVERPQATMVPLAVRTLLAMAHILGSGSGKVSYSTNLFETGFPERLTIHTPSHASVSPSFQVFTMRGYMTYCEGKDFTTTISPQLNPAAVNSRIMVTSDFVTSEAFPWLITHLCAGPGMLFYAVEPNHTVVSIDGRGVVSNYPYGTDGDLARLYNMFHLPGCGTLDIVVIDAPVSYEWPWKDGVIICGTTKPVEDPDHEGAILRVMVDEPEEVVGLSGLFPQFSDNYNMLVSDMIRANETLWNIIVTNWATREEIEIAIKMAAALAVVLQPQARVYGGVTNSYSALSCYPNAAAVACSSTLSSTEGSVWEQATYNDKQCLWMTRSVTLPLGQNTAVFTQWNKVIEQFTPDGPPVGRLPIQNPDYITLHHLEIYTPVTTSMFSPSGANLLTSLNRCVRMAQGLASVTDLLCYLANTSATSFCADRYGSVEKCREELEAMWPLQERFLDKLFGFELRDIVNRSAFFKQPRVSAGQLAAMPPLNCAQRVPLAIIDHFCGLRFGSDARLTLTERLSSEVEHVFFRGCGGNLLLDTMGLPAPRRAVMKDNWQLLLRWYADTMGSISRLAKGFNQTTIAAIYDNTQERPVLGFCYTYFSPSEINSYIVDSPIFPAQSTLDSVNATIDLSYVQNQSLPIMVGPDPSYEANFRVISLVESWNLVDGVPWAHPVIAAVSSVSAKDLMRELRLAKNLVRARDLFLD